ncbi:MAG: DNA repair protein RecN [Blastocatellia bacterium]|jgi:DNA repair protein RecN (Recombination protein N)
MLRYLNIINLALIEQVQIEFKPGLNLLSGETGSGKSIIIDALGLLQGERGTADLIRGGASRAVIEGMFDVEGNEPLLSILRQTGMEGLDEGLVIRRELGTGSGRGRIFVNHQLANQALLRQIQPHIIDLHGQGDQQSLLQAEAQRDLLDAYAEAQAERQEVAGSFDLLLGSVKRLEAGQQSETERLQSLDLLHFQIEELESAGLLADEEEALLDERRRLANGERIANLSHEAFALLYENEEAVLTQLGGVQRRMAELASLDSTLLPIAEQLTTARHSIEDLSFQLRDYLQDLQISPARLQEVEDRLAEIDRLKRKYGGPVSSLIEKLEALRQQRNELLHHEERREALRDEVGRDLAAYQVAVSALTARRLDAITRLQAAVVAELADVALPQARWEVRWKRVDSSPLGERLAALGLGANISPRRSGAETIEFYFSANPGEELRPLGAVASGGELSRLMLILKTIIAPTLFPRTLIFDEIDTGIGGKVADAVGLRLKRLASSNQVLCVTHQSLIARYADAHFQVSKAVIEGRTLTDVVELDRDGRIEELARMIGGAEVTTLARRHARELLRS